MKKIVYLSLSLTLTGLIFALSAQSADISVQMSEGFSTLIFKWVQLISDQISFSTFHLIVRKCAHVGEYLLLGYFYTMTWFLYKKNIVYVVIIGLGIALIDEGIQIFTEGRGPSIIDVIIFDFGGFLIGWSMTRFIKKIKYPFNVS